MPRGERQTTGTAQALLGAKQIAAQERASKRATVADYVKTGVGALKGVGDYLQKKQALEQNQDKLNLEQSLFSAQYGDVGEQGRKRQQEENLRLENIGLAGAQTKVAQGTIDAQIKAAEGRAAELTAGGLKAGVEADVAVETQPDVVKGVRLGVKKLEEGVRALKVDTDIKEIRKGFVAALDQGQVDLVQAKVEGINAEITAGIARTEDNKEKIRLEGKRLDISTTYHKAMTDKLVADGVIDRETADRETEKWDLVKGTPEHHEILRKLELRVKTATTEKAEAEAKALPELLDIDVKTGYAKLKTEEKRAPLIEAQTRAIGSEQYIAFEKLGLLKKDQTLRGWVAEQGNARAIDEIELARGRAATDKARLSLDMLRLQLEKEKQGFAEEEASKFAARWSLEFKAKFGSEEYQKELQQAMLATEKAKPGQEATRTALIKAQATALEMDNLKKSNQLLSGLNDLQVEEKDKKILTYTKLAKRLPQFSPEMSGAEKELKANNLQGPNTVFMDQISALVDDGVTTAGKLSGDHYNALTEEEGFWSGVVSGSMPGTSLVADLGTQYYNLPQDQQEKFVEWLAREWPEGTKKLFELGDVRQSWWSRKWRGFGPAKGLENIGAAFGSGAQTYEDEFQLELNFLHGLAAGMNAVQKGGRPSDAANFREFQAVPMSPRGMGALDIGLPSERVRAPIPE